MAYNKSKAKGASFETKIKDKLNDTFPNIQFERVPLSGAISYLKGDIWTPNDTAKWPWCIECKHYAELDWDNFLTAKSNVIFGFWKQATREAIVMKKKPLLIFRENRSKDFVAYNDDIIVKNFVQVSAFDETFKICLLDDWLVAVKTQTDLAKS